jgi:ribokinase
LFDVITVGSATVDAFINTGSKLFKKSFFKNYVSVPFGSKILIEDLKFEIGGGGTNTAVALSRLGLKTAYLGSIGIGTNSQRVIKLLEKEKVETSLIQKEDGRTGFSVILDASGHDRTILTFKGNNDNLNFSKIPKEHLKTRWFYFSAMMNKSFETQVELANYAKKHKIKIAYNPSSYLVQKGAKYLKPLLEKTSLLILNKEEAACLVGKTNPKKTLMRLLKLGPELAVVTDGPNPIHAAEGKYLYYLKPSHVKVVEATGAGDAFAAAFLAGIIEKGEIEFALKLGLAESQSVVTNYGPKQGLLKYKELLEKTKNLYVKKELL